MGLPYIGCLPLHYLLSNPRSRVEQLGELLNVQYQRALRGRRLADMCKSVKYPENLLLIPDQEQRQRCLASSRVTFAVLEMSLAVYSTGAIVRCLGQRRKDELGLVGDVSCICSIAVSAPRA